MPRRRRRKRRHSGSLTSTVSHLLHPSARNQHRPKLLHAESLLYFSLIVLAAFSLMKALRFFPGLETTILGYASNITAEQVLSQTNEQRAAEGLAPLELNNQLSSAALSKGQNMFQDQYWSHTSPSGVEPWSFIQTAGYQYKTAGENLARDFMSTNDLVGAWMASATHRANILNPQFEEIGIAVIDGKLEGFETTLVVQMFGTPKVSQATVVSPPQLLANAAEETAPLAAVTGPGTQQTAVLAGTTLSPLSLRNSVLFSPLQLTKAFFLAVIILITVTLVYDSFIANNRRAARIVTKNLGHLVVFSAVTFIIVFFRSGVIN